MTMTSLQAGHLRRALQQPDDRAPATLNRATYPVWLMNAIGDVSFHHAETEPVLAEWFLRRFSLLDSLYMVPPPRIVGRAVAHNLKLWLGGRRQASRARRTVTAPRSP
jgi:predicted ATPase